MAYIGQQVNIPLGQQGLLTDDPATQIPPTALIKANNIRFTSGRIEKAPGSVKFNSSALTGGIVGLFDWFPSGTLQRLIAATSDGKVFRDTGSGDFTAGVPITTGLGALTVENTKFVAGGNESAADNRKLFLFSNTNQLRFIDGDATTFTVASDPAADWTSSFPTYGVVHRDRLWAFGNSNAPHRIYASTTSDHANFVDAGSLTFNLFPGESDRILSAFVYKDRLFFFKFPLGMYFLDDTSFTEGEWRVGRVEGNFGVASPHSVIQILSDLVAGNATGSITSLQATDAFGDIKSGDILANSKIEQFVRDLTTTAGVSDTQALYYPEKKLAYFTTRKEGSVQNDLLLVSDVNKQGVRWSVNNRDVAQVLALRKDSDAIDRPIYGDSLGFVYQMDQSATFAVDGVAYTTEFQTPEIDFSFLDPSLAGKNKIFDFFTLIFIETADLPLSVDVIIDGKTTETLSINQASGVGLDDFILDETTLSGEEPNDARKHIKGCGKRISFRIFSTNTVTFKLEQIIVGFRLGDEGNPGGVA